MPFVVPGVAQRVVQRISALRSVVSRTAEFHLVHHQLVVGHRRRRSTAKVRLRLFRDHVQLPTLTVAGRSPAFNIWVLLARITLLIVSVGWTGIKCQFLFSFWGVRDVGLFAAIARGKYFVLDVLVVLISSVDVPLLLVRI